MMLKKFISFGILTFVINTPTLASLPQENSIQQAIELSHINDMLTDTIKVTSSSFDRQATDLVKHKTGHNTLTEQDTNAVQEISKIMNSNLTDMLQAFDLQKLTENAFRKYYTEEELQVYIKFLATPEGQSINKKTPILLQDIMKNFSDTFQNNKDLKDKIKSYNDQIQLILNSLPKHQK